MAVYSNNDPPVAGQHPTRWPNGSPLHRHSNGNGINNKTSGSALSRMLLVIGISLWTMWILYYRPTADPYFLLVGQEQYEQYKQYQQDQQYGYPVAENIQTEPEQSEDGTVTATSTSTREPSDTGSNTLNPVEGEEDDDGSTDGDDDSGDDDGSGDDDDDEEGEDNDDEDNGSGDDDGGSSPADDDDDNDGEEGEEGEEGEDIDDEDTGSGDDDGESSAADDDNDNDGEEGEEEEEEEEDGAIGWHIDAFEAGEGEEIEEIIGCNFGIFRFAI